MRLPYLIAATVSLGAIATALYIFGNDADGWQHATRWTARVSACVFLVAFLIAPVARRWPAFGLDASAASGWSLGFALAHGIHLTAIVTYFRVSGTAPDPVVLIVGGTGYVAIGVMVLASAVPLARTLGAYRPPLVATCLYVVWVVFALSYGIRLLESETFLVGAVGSAAFWMALGMRLIGPDRMAARHA